MSIDVAVESEPLYKDGKINKMHPLGKFVLKELQRRVVVSDDYRREAYQPRLPETQPYELELAYTK